MLKQGVILPVRDPTELVSNILPAKTQNGKLRICLDPIHLNRALGKNSHPMKRLEHIRTKLAGACYFSALDADEGFWQLDKNARQEEFHAMYIRHALGQVRISEDAFRNSGGVR